MRMIKRYTMTKTWGYDVYIDIIINKLIVIFVFFVILKTSYIFIYTYNSILYFFYP